MLHRNIVLGDNHAIQQWEVANTAARLALTVLSIDIGKVAYQFDDNTFWVLVAITPTWVELTNKAVMTGISFADATPVTAADTLLIAIGKLQAQITALTP